MANNHQISTTSASRLDVATAGARGFDLTSTLINNSNSSNPTVNVLFEVGQWLGREKLNSHELQDVLRKARGVAFPNHNAQLLLEDVWVGTRTLAAGPFFIQTSGSLGRLMANDPSLSWMVTTVTCLYQCHSTSEVNRCVRDLIIVATRQDPDAPVGVYDPSKVYLRRVVDKIVSSIWLNVVNAGRMTIQLPEELVSLCQAGHHLESPDFATLKRSLHTDRPRLMVQTPHLLRNVTLWLLYHFDGLLQIVVRGRIVYSRRLGDRPQEIELRVSQSCSETGSCGNKERSAFELFDDISGNPKSFLSGSYPPTKLRGHSETSMVRRKLYHLPDTHTSESRARQQGMQILIRCTAQKIMRWLLDLSVLPPFEFTNLGFHVELEGNSSAGSRKIRDLLRRSPSMLNQRWGDSPLPNVVYFKKITDADSTSNIGTAESNSSVSSIYRNRTYDEVVPFFPILQDLLGEVRPMCRCSRCEDGTSLNFTLIPGCLRHVALVECLYLLAHGIADGFGVTDASGVSDVQVSADGMLYLLFDLVEEQGILWDIWFGVAASLYLGCACPCLPNTVDTTETSTTAAVQYGDLAVIAPWLDLNKELRIDGCFHLTDIQGRLSILTPGSTSETYSRRIAENYALIRTERTELIPERPLPHDLLAPGSPMPVSGDKSPLEVDWILAQIQDSEYSLMMRVKSADYSRIVDPTSAIIRVAREFTALHQCAHASDTMPLVLEPDTCGEIYSFNDLLGLWETWENTSRFKGHNPLNLSGAKHLPGTIGTIHMTEQLESLVKQNIAFAVSVNENLIWSDGSACHKCLLSRAKAARPPHPDLDRPPHDHYIINVRKSLQHRIGDRKVGIQRQIAGPSHQIEQVRDEM